LIAFLAGLHLGIARLAFDLGQDQSSNQTGIDDAGY
jgi:hypothetical protein